MCSINRFVVMAILSSLALTLTLASPIGNPLILGGELAKADQLPYQASICVLLLANICGGSIISENYVVTAAHCKSPLGRSPAAYVVSVGAQSRYGGYVHRVKRMVIHDEYDAMFHNDIALLEMSSPIKFDMFVARIPLGRDFIDSGVEAVVSGWGITHPLSARYLRFGALTTLRNDECREMYKHTVDNYIHDFGVLCAYSGQKGKGVEIGDSGGPLAYNNTLIGVISFGTTWSGIGYPVAFTRVSHYIDWIEKFTGTL